MRPRLLAATVALLLAGCMGDAGPADDAPAPLARDVTAYFTPDMRLSAEIPAAGAVRAGSFFAAWAEGRDYPTWEGAPVERDLVVTALEATVYVRATGPVVESGRFPDLMIYGASGGAFMAVATTKIESVLLPGDVHEVMFELQLPHGGLVVPAGEPIAFKVVPVMHQNDAADVEILVGGDAASRATWTQEQAALPRVALQHERAQGEAVGSAYAGPAAPESTRHRIPVALAEAPRTFLVWMNTTDHAGIPDIDLALVGPGGEEIASSGTPTPREFLRLAEPNLQGAGEYTIVVASYGSARATFTVEWLVG